MFKGFTLVAILFCQLQSLASNGSNTINNREAHKFGLGLGFGSPSPALIGAVINYNINNKIRAGIGYGEVEVTTGISFGETATIKTAKATTYDVGAEYMVLDSNFTPIVGLHVSRVDFSGEGQLTILNFEKDTTNFYSNLGLDWQSKGGFNFAFGYNLSALGTKYSHSYMNMGWFY